MADIKKSNTRTPHIQPWYNQPLKITKLVNHAFFPLILVLDLISTLKIARNATNSKRDWVAVALDDLMTLDTEAIYGFLCKHLVTVFVLRVIAVFY